MLALRILWSMMSRMEASLQFDTVLGAKLAANRHRAHASAPQAGTCAVVVGPAQSTCTSQTRFGFGLGSQPEKPIQAPPKRSPRAGNYPTQEPLSTADFREAMKSLIETVRRLERLVTHRKNRALTISNRYRNAFFLSAKFPSIVRLTFAIPSNPGLENLPKLPPSLGAPQPAVSSISRKGRLLAQ
jgi:hypothetical protein